MRIPSSIFLVAALVIVGACSDQASGADQPHLIGNWQKESDLVSSVSEIVVAKFTQPAWAAASGMNLAHCIDGKISIIKTLKGTAVGSQKVSYTLQILPTAESQPEVGPRYILFLRARGSGFDVEKVVAFDDKSLSRIKALITSSQGR
jgi:hypothetical protein